MKSYMQKKETVERKWYVIDAEGKSLGRVATLAAAYLRGKHKPTYTPHIDCGDNIIIINASEVLLTGNKLENKKYYNHSRYVGGLRERTAKEMKANGDSYTHIAAKMGFSAGFVYKCLRFKTYEDLQEFREKDAKASAQRKRVAKMKKEGIVEPKKNYEVPKKSYEETAKPAISQELIEIRSVADSLARIAEALESIKELQVYKKRSLFHK